MKEKRNYIGVEKHIRITDIEIGNQIERIMELPEYKSFNKVITEALFYGGCYGKERQSNKGQAL